MDDLLTTIGLVLFLVFALAVFDPQRFGQIGADIVCGFRGDCQPTP